MPRARRTKTETNELQIRFVELGGEIESNEGSKAKIVKVGDRSIAFVDESSLHKWLLANIETMESFEREGDEEWYSQFFPENEKQKKVRKPRAKKTESTPEELTPEEPTPTSKAADKISAEYKPTQDVDKAINNLSRPVLAIPTVNLFNSDPKIPKTQLKDVEQMSLAGVTRAELCDYFKLDGGINDIELARSLAQKGICLKVERGLDGRNSYKPHIGFAMPKESLTRA